MNLSFINKLSNMQQKQLYIGIGTVQCVNILIEVMFHNEFNLKFQILSTMGILPCQQRRISWYTHDRLLHQLSYSGSCELLTF